MIVDGLQPTYLKDALEKIAKHMGKDACRDRDELVCLLNEFREMLYIDNRVPRLFDEMWHCVKLSCYPMECYKTCSCEGKTFKGFILPEYIESIEQAFSDDTPLRIHSTWWEARTGRKDGRYITEAIVPTDIIYPTQRALTKPSDIVFLTDEPDNCGKKIIITVVDDCCDENKVEVTLNDTTPQVIKGVNGITEVQIPDELKGLVTLQQSDGHILSQFNKYTRVPRYRLFKVLNGYCRDQILIKGKKKYLDVCWDSDIVEVGSNLILKEFSKYIKYGDDSLDGAEINKANASKGEMYRLIGSAYENKYGKQIEDSISTMKGFNLIPKHKQLC